jgi:subtilase family serine protease
MSVTAPGGGIYVPAGGSTEVNVSLPALSYGEYAVVWTVDPSDNVLESSGMNNSRWCPFTVENPTSGTLSDLVVSNIAVTPASGPPGTEFTFAITVENLGPGDSPFGAYQLTTCTLDGASFNGDIDWSGYRTLAPGETVTHRMATDQSFIPGTHRFECTVDMANRLEETNENNNTHAIQFVVTSDER